MTAIRHFHDPILLPLA